MKRTTITSKKILTVRKSKNGDSLNLLSVAVLASSMIIGTPAMAQMAPTPTIPSYTLDDADKSDPNTVNIPEYNRETGAVTDKYYQINYKNTEYGEGTENSADYKAKIPTDDVDITVKYDNSDKISRLENYSPITDEINGIFINNNISDSQYSVGGAIRNESSISTINAGFVANSNSSNTNAEGGAIYNSGTIDNLGGYFIKNSLSPITSGSAYNIGGAIANTGTIGNINADFISNSIINPNGSATALGGAIYNTNYINSINGDFVNNIISIKGDKLIAGGAIYNSSNWGSNNPTIGSIKGNFIGNSLSSSGTDSGSALGGAIYNASDANTTASIGSITGDFIKNSVSGSYARGGAIYNSGSIGDITGNFIENSSMNQGGAIFNSYEGSNTSSTLPVINSITGNFIGNYSTGTGFSAGAAIFNRGIITNGIKGSFISNYIESNYTAQGGAIFNSNYQNPAIINGIEGDFVNNKIISTSGYSAGGAIYNEVGKITDKIKGNFISNSIVGGGADGAAIANVSGGQIADIEGNFVNNTIESSGSVKGGAIANRDKSSIGNITGDFYKNSVKASSTVEGGAISNSNSTMGKITGNFIENTVISDNGTVKGGAIYNDKLVDGGIGSGSTFVGNSISTKSGSAEGGAIYNGGYNSGISMTGNSPVEYYFANNYAESKNATAYGGAIYNSNATFMNTDIKADFIDNHVKGNSTSEGGAIFNQGTMGSLTGTFANNYAESNDFTAGGAIFNGGTLGTIAGKFANNYAVSTGSSSGAEGGAIYYSGTLNNLNADFANNYVKANGHVKGGAVFTYGSLSLDGEHTFVNNRAISKDYNAQGGAIYASSGIDSLKGTFDKNYVEAGQFAQGGAVFTYGRIEDVNTTMANSHATSATKNAEGGALYAGSIGKLSGTYYNNYVQAKDWAKGGAVYARGIDTISATFANNKATSIDESALGGAINSEGNIGKIENSTFQANSSTSKNGYGHGGALFTSSAIGEIKNTNFINNNASTDGGALWTAGKVDKISNSYFSGNKAGNMGGAIYSTGQIETISNTSFVNNSAKSVGGAIYTTNDLNIESTNGYTTVYSGNTDMSGSNVIYLDRGDSAPKLTLNLNANTNGKFVLNDSINGNKLYNLNLNGDKSGQFYINNGMKNADITQSNVTSYLDEGTTLNGNNSLSINSGVMNINHLGLAPVSLRSFANNGTINIDSVDINPATETMGRITANSYGTSDGTINVNNLNILADPTKATTNVLFADKSFANTVKYHGTDLYMGKIYKYSVGYLPDSGEFQFIRGAGSSGADAFNPSVLSTAVNSQAGTNATVNETFKYVFEHADAFSQLPSLDRFAMINENRYALSTDFNGNLGPSATEFNNKAGWFRPYATFEKMNLRNASAVNATTYGSLVGFDSDFQHFGKGWTGISTGYIGYNGSQLRYSGADTTMNGGLIGLTQSFYKGNFWTALTLSSGASVGESTTMYGKDNFTTLFAGLGSKTGYNFEFKQGRYIIQPIWFMSYTFAKTFDYTNAAGVRMDSDPMHSLQLNPSVRFIANTENGWQPYVSVGMVWNAMSISNVHANDVKLPEASIKPYIEYGIGVQKRFQDHFIAFGQAMVRNGGRNGVSLTAGFRWAIGHDHEKSKEKVSLPQPKLTFRFKGKAAEKLVGVTNDGIADKATVKGMDSAVEGKISANTSEQPARKIIKQLTPEQRVSLGAKPQDSTRTTSLGSLKQM